MDEQYKDALEEMNITLKGLFISHPKFKNCITYGLSEETKDQLKLQIAQNELELAEMKVQFEKHNIDNKTKVNSNKTIDYISYDVDYNEESSGYCDACMESPCMCSDQH